MRKTSLDALAREHLKKARSSSSGRSASAVFGGHEHRLRQTLLALQADATMAEHDSPGEATLYVLHGRVRLDAGTDSWEGRDGDLLVIPPTRHALHALTDAAVLLTTITGP